LLIKRILSALNASVYRLTDGQVAGTIPGGAPLLLLERTSSRTGKVRTATLLHVTDPEDAEKVVVVGSSGGGPRDPDWIRYIRDGSLSIRVGADRWAVQPVVLRPDDDGYDGYMELLQSRDFFFEQHAKRVAAQAERDDVDDDVRKVIPIAVLKKQSTTVTGEAS